MAMNKGPNEEKSYTSYINIRDTLESRVGVVESETMRFNDSGYIEGSFYVMDVAVRFFCSGVYKTTSGADLVEIDFYIPQTNYLNRVQVFSYNPVLADIATLVRNIKRANAKKTNK